MPKSRRSLVLLAAIGVSCLLSGCGDLARSGFRSAAQRVGAELVEASSDENLRSMFEQANAACPTRMDEYTTLEEVVMIDDQHVEFRYRVNDRGKQIASRFDKRAMKKAAVAHMKGNPMAVAIAERDLSIEHIYQDKFGGHILSYTINRDVLNGNFDPVGAEQPNPFSTQVVSAGASESVVDVPVADSVVFDPPVAEPVKEEPPLPQQFKPKRTKENPAGVRTNPFFEGN